MGNICRCKRKTKVLQPLPSLDKINVRREVVKNDYHTSPRTVQLEVSKHQQMQPEGRIVVAVYPYNARDNTELSFSKGDRFVVLNDRDSDWWEVYHIKSEKSGYLPWNFVAEEESVELKEWYFGYIIRKDAEKLLLQKSNSPGTFLVRKSERSPGCYALSVKLWCDERNDYMVRHYKIKCLDSGGYYILPTNQFANLANLVDFYLGNDALGFILTNSCLRPKPHQWDLSAETKDCWEIDRSDIKLIEKLGSGNFGDVWYGVHKNNVEVAVKTLKSATTMSKEAFLQEALIMKQFRHEKLVTLYAVCTTSEPFYIVTEYMCNGSLLDYLHSPVRDDITTLTTIDMASQIACGMVYLEARQLVHRDLAARNVLVGEMNIMKIADFGLARVLEDSEYSSRPGSRFPTKWTAPEAILYSKFSCKSDIWSFGILLMEIVTKGEMPYPGMSGSESFERVRRGYRMPKPRYHECTDELYDIMTLCWQSDPVKRPTFEYLYNFFDDYSVSAEADGYRNPKTVI